MLTLFNTKHLSWVDGGETSLNYYEMFADTLADMPSDVYHFSTATEKYKISQGSLVYVISSGEMYMMNSSGSWIKQ